MYRESSSRRRGGRTTAETTGSRWALREAYKSYPAFPEIRGLFSANIIFTADRWCSQSAIMEKDAK